MAQSEARILTLIAQRFATYQGTDGKLRFTIGVNVKDVVAFILKETQSCPPPPSSSS